MNIADDLQFEDYRLTKVKRGTGGWEVKQDSGWSFWCPDKGIEPHVGDIARFYGRGTGYRVRGLAINGQVVFYRTEEQDRADATEQAAEETRRKRADYAEKAEGYERVYCRGRVVFGRAVEPPLVPRDIYRSGVCVTCAKFAARAVGIAV